VLHEEDEGETHANLNSRAFKSPFFKGGLRGIIKWLLIPLPPWEKGGVNQSLNGDINVMKFTSGKPA
jgi:hypothetical protein